MTTWDKVFMNSLITAALSLSGYTSAHNEILFFKTILNFHKQVLADWAARSILSPEGWHIRNCNALPAEDNILYSYHVLFVIEMQA